MPQAGPWPEFSLLLLLPETPSRSRAVSFSSAKKTSFAFTSCRKRTSCSARSIAGFSRRIISSTCMRVKTSRLFIGSSQRKRFSGARRLVARRTFFFCPSEKSSCLPSKASRARSSSRRIEKKRLFSMPCDRMYSGRVPFRKALSWGRYEIRSSGAMTMLPARSAMLLFSPLHKERR